MAPSRGPGPRTSEELRRVARFFATVAELRAWFSGPGATATELWIAYPKAGAPRKALRYGEVVEEALCFGWVDGQVRSLGPEAYANRYTPRRPESKWSGGNLAKVARLTREGRMAPVGLAVFESRVRRPAGYTFEEAPKSLDPALRAELDADSPARAFFEVQSPSYRRRVVFWIMSAKRPETRRRRFEVVRRAARQGRRIDELAPSPSLRRGTARPRRR
ncbi:MAG TPA: YdeI/OmpD-associated family protein [Thermoplasmata archaeon]|nr:YdeI/OmpD-associated family protein [Thermoplasmata archaeon]